MSGFTDYLRMILGWMSAPPNLVFRCRSMDVQIAGFKVADIAAPGFKQADTHQPGASAMEIQ